MVGHGLSSAGSYLADPTSPIPSHCASIVATSTVRVNRCIMCQCVCMLVNYIYLLLKCHISKFVFSSIERNCCACVIVYLYFIYYSLIVFCTVLYIVPLDSSIVLRYIQYFLMVFCIALYVVPRDTTVVLYYIYFLIVFCCTELYMQYLLLVLWCTV